MCITAPSAKLLRSFTAFKAFNHIYSSLGIKNGCYIIGKYIAEVYDTVTVKTAGHNRAVGQNADLSAKTVAEKFAALNIGILIRPLETVIHFQKHMLPNTSTTGIFYPLTGQIFLQCFQSKIVFAAVKAAHSDPFAVGVIIEDLVEDKKYYVTGDTLYNTEIFDDLPDDLYAVFLPINGIGNNMNVRDAERFAKRTGATKAVPIHVGMFDGHTPDIFKADNRVLPEIYKEIRL